MKAKHIYIAIGTCAIIALIFANPFTRAIFLFLLPLGSGFDDFIEIIAIVAGIGFAIYYFVRKARIDVEIAAREQSESQAFKKKGSGW